MYAGSSTKFGDRGLSRDATPYAVSKAKNSELVKKRGDENNLPYAVTYFYNVYGPGERSGIYGTVVESFKQMYLHGAPLAVTSPGTQERNFTHIKDIVEGLVLVGERGHGDGYGLGSERTLTILELARLFNTPIVMLPERAGSRRQSSLDSSKTRELEWSPKYSVEEYVREFVSIHKPGVAREKRVLVFSTTFYPTMGPAEEALMELIERMSDVEFDVVTSTFSKGASEPPLKNLKIHRVGFGRPVDKYFLPIFGYRRAKSLHAKHKYLFTWSIMASYAALAGVLLKRIAGLPLLITLADQKIENISFLARLGLKIIMTDADQIYGASNKIKDLQHSLGEGDAFANQLRYAYAEIIRERQNPFSI